MPHEWRLLMSAFDSDDLILRPTTFPPSALHYDSRLGAHPIERLGDACYWILWFPAACAIPGDVVFPDLEGAKLETCPHCERATCPVLERVRKLADWRRFMKRRR
jgi:hypothetical protein